MRSMTRTTHLTSELCRDFTNLLIWSRWEAESPVRPWSIFCFILTVHNRSCSNTILTKLTKQRYITVYTGTSLKILATKIVFQCNDIIYKLLVCKVLGMQPYIKHCINRHLLMVSLSNTFMLRVFEKYMAGPIRLLVIFRKFNYSCH